MKILADASFVGLESLFPSPFHLTYYHHQDEIPSLLEGIDILLCRSTLVVNKSLFTRFHPRGVATASSGSDHVDVEFLEKIGIRFWDAKGSNAQSVVEYVLACIAYAEKNAKPHAQTVGIIGCGAVGSLVGINLQNLGFDVKYYDPLKSASNSDFYSAPIKAILSSDIICIHANLHDKEPHPSRNLIGRDELSLLKDNTLIINAARGGIVSEEDLLSIPKNIIYCTDVYANEPMINKKIIDFAYLATPHIAGHSIEAKQNVLKVLSQKLNHYLVNTKYSPDKDLTINKAHAINWDNTTSWQEQILSHYNPMLETKALKQAEDIKTEFLELRKAHTFRHEFTSAT